MPDGFIQVPADSVGKKVDTNEITRADSSVVERQRFEIPAGVVVDGDVLRQVLVELMLQTTLWAQASGITDNLDQLRTEIRNSL